jgi:hypothetical protein
MVAASSHVPFFLGAEYPNGYMAECYFLFLQEQTKDIIIKGNFRLPEPRFKIFAVVPSFRRILKKTNLTTTHCPRLEWRGIVEDMYYEIRRGEACVELSDCHHALV